MKRRCIGVLLLLLCLMFCACGSPDSSETLETVGTPGSKEQATASILSHATPFTLDNAEGEVYIHRVDDSERGDMNTYDVAYGLGVPADVCILTDASDYFVFHASPQKKVSLLIRTWREDGENYHYRVEGTGIQEVTMGIDGLFVVGESADCRLDAFVFGELDHSITLYCKGDQISLIPDGDLLYVEGVEEELEITLTRGFGTSKRCAITIPGGSGILDVSSMIADEIAVIAEDGTRTEYHILFP